MRANVGNCRVLGGLQGFEPCGSALLSATPSSLARLTLESNQKETDVSNACDIVVKKTDGGNPVEQKIKDCRFGDVVKVPTAFGTYIVVGVKTIDSNEQVEVLHIVSEHDGDVAPRLTSISLGARCIIVGRMHTLEWSGL